MCTALLQTWMDASFGFQPTSNWCAHFVLILLGRHASIITSDSLLTTLSLSGCVFSIFDSWIFHILCELCRGSGGDSLASWGGGIGSFPRQSMWLLWWTIWPCDGCVSEYLGFVLYHSTRSFIHHRRLVILATGSFVKYQTGRHFITLYPVMLYILILNK
jgi:hypothetical protein